jgi:hypothetical protein
VTRNECPPALARSGNQYDFAKRPNLAEILKFVESGAGKAELFAYFGQLRSNVNIELRALVQTRDGLRFPLKPFLAHAILRRMLR